MRLALIALAAATVVAAAAVDARQGDLSSVSGTVSVVGEAAGAPGAANVAVWLKAIGGLGDAASGRQPRPEKRTIVQRNKHFEPHLLIVPVGSVVSFPNDDPFFHNVFSLFDGRRFDLGLYEAGTSRTAPFTKPGVCFIFCNIHPEMSAVVVVVDTPYYAVTNKAGDFIVPNVPPGRYALSVWHERYKPERPQDLPRDVTISGGHVLLGNIRLAASEDTIVPHKNKYGHDYNPPSPTSPTYRDR